MSPVPRHLGSPVAIAVLAATLASAASAHAAGINLSWSDCGTHGVDLAAFACNSNTGYNDVIGSFVPPAGVDALVGIEAEIGIEAQANLPDWWKHGNGFCRGTTGLSASFDFTSLSTSCGDPWEGQASGGLVYDVAYGGPNLARLRVLAAMPADLAHPVDPSVEYAAFRVRVLHSKSTGTGACAGCATPIRLTLNSIQLDQPAGGAADVALTNAIDNTVIYWQGRFGPLPRIDGFTPAGGVAGDVVTISGARLGGATAVAFGASPAAFDVIDDGGLHATVPDGVRTGYLSVQTPDGLATSAARFIVAPVISAVTPSRAPVGTTITITGMNFTETSRVEFNGVSAPFVVASDTQIYPRVPEGATDGPVAVFDAGGSATSSETFHVGPAPTPGEGTINLSWDDCGVEGVAVKAFACNTNVGAAFTMVGSFKAPENIFALNGMYAEISMVSLAAALPDWWRFGPNQCRSTSLAANFDFTAGPTSCLDPWEQQASGGCVYDIGYGGAERARLRIVAAVPGGLEQVLEAGSQYYAFKVTLNRTHTTGTGACSGCDVAARFTLEQVQLYQTSDQNYDPILTAAGDRTVIYWQSSLGFPPEAPPTTGVTDAPARLAIARASVSAGGRALAFAVVLPHDAPATLGVFDAGGRRIAGDRLNVASPGMREWRIDAARALAPGVYFARVTQSNASAVRRFVVLR